MSAGSSRLQFILSLVDRVSGPLTRIQARLHAMGLEQMKLFSQNFHSYGNAAAETARKVALITTALTAAIAATGALVSAMAPMAAMAGASLGAAIGTANTAGVSRESAQLEQQTGMSQGQIQAYRQAGRMVGMDAGFGQVGDVGTVFTEIHQKLQAPKDSGLADTLKKVKLPLSEIKGLKPDQLLQRVSSQMDKLGMTDIKKSQILDELAGDASKLLPLLGKNADALGRFSTHAAKVGAIITPEQAELMKITNREVALMKTGVEGYGNILSTVGGNFMKLFGPEINQWFADNADGMRQWADDSVKELQRLHGVFKAGGLQAVYESLFPNLSAFTQRIGAFVTGFSASFATPFMETVRSVWARVAAVLGNTAGGAQGFGSAFGAAILPVMAATMAAIGDAVIFLERNWDFVKQLFAWSPLGLVISNWGAITSALEPVGNAIKDLAEYFGLVAPGVNESGSSLGSLFGVLGALAGVVMLNKIAFGAVYHVVKLYQGVMVLVRASTMIVTAATWAWNAAMTVLRIGMIAMRALSLVGFLITMGASMAAASIGTWTLAGAMAFLTSPITLIVVGLAALAGAAYYLYTHWAQVKAYLGETAWGRSILSVIDAISHPMESLGNMMGALSGWWADATASIGNTDIGSTIMESIANVLDPSALMDLLKTFLSDGFRGVFKSVFSGMAGEVSGALFPVLTAMSSHLSMASAFLMRFAVVQRGVAVASGLLTYGLSVAKAALLNFSLVQKIMAASSAMMAGGMALVTAPITLIVAGLAALAAGAYFLYTHWAQVKAYLGETAWGQALLTAIGWVTSPLQTFNSLVDYLSGLWASTKSSLAETTWGQMILTAINMLFSPIELFNGAITAWQGAWDGIKGSLSDTGWGQAILGAIDSIMAGIERFKAGWAEMKAAASEKIGGAWGSFKSAVGFGDSSPANGGARALGGTVLPGHFYRVNERGPELMQTMGQTFLMTGGAAGNIIPFPTATDRTTNNSSATAGGTASVTNLTDRLINNNATSSLSSLINSSTSNNSSATAGGTASVTSLTDRLINNNATSSLSSLISNTASNNSATAGGTASVTNLTDRLINNNATSSLSSLISNTSLSDSFTSLDKGMTGGVSLPEARPLNVRDLFGADGKRGGNNSPARSGKTITIGAVHIHTNNKIDPYELEQQLGMLG